MKNEPLTTRKRKITRLMEAYDKREIPQSSYDLAVKRTAHLENILRQSTPEYIAACAYLQGIDDAVETFNRRGMILPEAANAGI